MTADVISIGIVLHFAVLLSRQYHTSIHVANKTRCAIAWLGKRNMTCLGLGLFAGQQRMRVTCDLATSVTDESNYSYLNKTSAHFDTSKPNLDYLEQPWRCRKRSSLQLCYLNEFIRRHVPEARALHSHRCANLRSRKLSWRNHAYPSPPPVNVSHIHSSLSQSEIIKHEVKILTVAHAHFQTK